METDPTRRAGSATPGATELEPGDEFAGHRILGIAGRGGMGIVYRALQEDLDRVVALKLIATPLARDESFRERFVRESRSAAAIDHPNVIPVYYAGEHDGRLYIAMRYVDGVDLRALAGGEGGLGDDRAASIIDQIGAALDAAHERGLIHRDVKPANVLLSGEHAYLTDFGLTKRLHSDSELTASGRWVGTLGYLAPEQIRGEPVDARADVYALGCLLHFALTGLTPFKREGDEATLWAHLNEPPPRVGGPMDAVIARALAKDPDDRFPSAGDLGRAALAAAGAAPAPTAERRVARGAAAPGGASSGETAIPASRAPTPAGENQVPGTSFSFRRLAGPAVALLAGAGTVLATAALLDDGANGGAAPTTTAPAAVAGRAAAEPVAVDRRPLDLAYASGTVWPVTFGTGRLRGFDAETGRRRIAELPGDDGTQAVAAGFGSVWTVNSRTRELVRLNPRTRRVQATIPLPPGQAVSVAAGARAVWVGVRATRDPLSGEVVLRVDPRADRIIRTIAVPSGVGDLDAGEGAVWIVTSRDRVLRIEASSGRQRFIGVGQEPRRIAVGAGYVWVTNRFDNTVSQISPETFNGPDILVGSRPGGVAAGKDAVWVANELDGTATRIDPRTSKVVGRPVEVGRNPLAVVVHGRSAWFASLADDAVTRVDF